MTELEFNRLASQGYNRIPVTLETFADLDTPLSIYLKLAGGPYSYLLESVRGGERFGRYSFIGLPALTRLAVYERSVMVLTGNRIAERRDDCDPLEFIGEYLTRRNVAPRLAATRKPDTLRTPDIRLLLSEEIAIVDNLSGKLTLVVFAEPGVPGAYQKTRQRLKDLLARLREPAAIPAETPAAPAPAESGVGEHAFKQAVMRAKDYIVEGDIMQVVLSQRLSKRFAATPLALYRALRTLNPSPYMFYFDLEDFHVVGASPEILVRLEGGKVTLRPIAGTRRRGQSADEDE